MSDITAKAAALIKDLIIINERRRGVPHSQKQAKYEALADRAHVLAYNFARIDNKFDQQGFIKSCGVEYKSAVHRKGRTCAR